MKTLCKSCVHNCTDNLAKIAPVKNGIWCNAGYGKTVKKKVINCKNYLKTTDIVPIKFEIS